VDLLQDVLAFLPRDALHEYSRRCAPLVKLVSDEDVGLRAADELLGQVLIRGNLLLSVPTAAPACPDRASRVVVVVCVWGGGRLAAARDMRRFVELGGETEKRRRWEAGARRSRGRRRDSSSISSSWPHPPLFLRHGVVQRPRSLPHPSLAAAHPLLPHGGERQVVRDGARGSWRWRAGAGPTPRRCVVAFPGPTPGMGDSARERDVPYGLSSPGAGGKRHTHTGPCRSAPVAYAGVDRLRG
jgi:hypothetical protein